MKKALVRKGGQELSFCMTACAVVKEQEGMQKGWKIFSVFRLAGSDYSGQTVNLLLRYNYR